MDRTKSATNQELFKHLSEQIEEKLELLEEKFTAPDAICFSLMDIFCSPHSSVLDTPIIYHMSGG